MASKEKRNMLNIRSMLIVIIVLLGLMVFFYAFNTFRNPQPRATNLNTGTGAPSGSHYNLNIIGKDGGTCNMSNTEGGRRIFVPLQGNSKILLSEGPFDVLDYCGLDGSASFQLPSPDPTNSGITVYSVWARALGKPGGSSSTTTCATDQTTGDLYCSLYTMVQTRDKGKSTFTNVSKELLYIFADINADGTTERIPLFDNRLENYYWQYDNSGLKVVQLRFYLVSTTIPAQ